MTPHDEEYNQGGILRSRLEQGSVSDPLHERVRREGSHVGKDLPAGPSPLSLTGTAPLKHLTHITSPLPKTNTHPRTSQHRLQVPRHSP